MQEFAHDWSEDRRELLGDTRSEILRKFWEGRFERLGIDGGPGTVLMIQEECRKVFPDQYFKGMPYGREEFFTQTFLGPCSLPKWRIWSSFISTPQASHDPRGLLLKLSYRRDPAPELLQTVFSNLRDCPFDKYSEETRVYLHGLAFPIEMLSRFFGERLRNRPPVLVKAQGRMSGAHVKSTAKRGRKQYEFDDSSLKKWFVAMVMRLSTANETISADKAHLKAQAEFHPKVSRAMIRRLHDELAPPT